MECGAQFPSIASVSEIPLGSSHNIDQSSIPHQYFFSFFFDLIFNFYIYCLSSEKFVRLVLARYHDYISSYFSFVRLLNSFIHFFYRLEEYFTCNLSSLATGKGVLGAIINALSLAPEDIRANLGQNIILTGGGAGFKGPYNSLCIYIYIIILI